MKNLSYEDFVKQVKNNDIKHLSRETTVYKDADGGEILYDKVLYALGKYKKLIGYYSELHGGFLKGNYPQWSGKNRTFEKVKF